MKDSFKRQIEIMCPKWKKFKIIKCGNPNAWYRNSIGITVEIKHFGTYGAFTKQNRWVDFWDLEEIKS